MVLLALTLPVLPGLASAKNLTAINQACQQDAFCSAAKLGKVTENKCRKQLDHNSRYPHDWRLSTPQPLFNSYRWYQMNLSLIEATGNKTYTVNQAGLSMPLNYYCIFNARNGMVIAAAFD